MANNLDEADGKFLRPASAEVEAVRGEHSVQLAQLREAHESEVVQLRGEHDEEMSKLRAELSADVEGLRAKVDAARADRKRAPIGGERDGNGHCERKSAIFWGVSSF